jgi:glutamyl-tRNA reductase
METEKRPVAPSAPSDDSQPFRLVLAGSDHQLVAPTRLQALAARGSGIQARLCELRQRGAIAGGFLLSTCNRIEVVLETAPDAPADLARTALGGDPELPLRELAGEAAVEHLLAVACGLHSLAFGEEQILGQVRSAYRTAEEYGLLSRRLQMLRSRLLPAARDVRRSVGLDHKPRSVAAMAADAVAAAGPRIAVVGAGATGRLVLEVLQRRGVAAPLVVNRTFARAQALAQHFGGEALALREFLQARPPLDGVVFAVEGGEVLLTKARAEGLRIAVDISQPSVFAPDLNTVPGLTVLSLDELATAAAAAADSYGAQRAAGLAEVRSRARQVWSELAAGRPDLGRVVDLHVESALAELEQAFGSELSHLAAADRAMLRSLLVRAAKRNAHYHVQDLRQLVPAR